MMLNPSQAQFSNLMCQLVEIGRLHTKFYHLALQISQKADLKYLIVEFTPTNLQPRLEHPETVFCQEQYLRRIRRVCQFSGHRNNFQKSKFHDTKR